MQNIVTLGQVNDALKFAAVTAAQLADMGFAALANKPICEALPPKESRRLRNAKLYPAESIGQIRVALAQRFAAPAVVTVPDGYFSYCDDDGFNKHDTLEAAKANSQNAIDMLREEAGTDEWPGAIDSVCYGVIVGRSTEVPQEPGPNGKETANYLLLAAH